MMAPKATAAAAAAHRPLETVIDRLPPLGFPDADADVDALGLELVPVAPPVGWALELSPGDAVVAVAWVVAGALGVVVASRAADAWLAAGPAGVLVGESTPLQLLPCEGRETLGQ